jgi:hypothetical protein
VWLGGMWVLRRRCLQCLLSRERGASATGIDLYVNRVARLFNKCGVEGIKWPVFELEPLRDAHARAHDSQ